MNTTQLECFVSVANFLNFSRAAEQLRITQPAVSHQINALEDELGIKLFRRSSKSVRLTPAGQLFIQYAEDMLKLYGLSKARLKECQETLHQRLGIGFRNYIELRLLRTALSKLRQNVPNLLPVLRLIPTASLDKLLEEEDVEILLSLQEELPPKAAYRELARCPLVCICAPDNPLAEFSQLSIQQLRTSGRIASCPPTTYPPALFAIQSQLLSGRGPEQILFCDSLEIVYTLVEAGYAFTVMPDLPSIRQPGLCYIPVPQFEPLSFGAIYRAGDRSPSLHLFLSFLKPLMES